jgi:hypothetical protein
VVFGVLLSGVKKGIERQARILMPALFVMLVGLVVFVLTLDNAIAGEAGGGGTWEGAEKPDVGGVFLSAAHQEGDVFWEAGEGDAGAGDGGVFEEGEIADGEGGAGLGVGEEIGVGAPPFGAGEGVGRGCDGGLPGESGEGGGVGGIGREEEEGAAGGGVGGELAVEEVGGFGDGGMPDDEGGVFPVDFGGAFGGEDFAGVRAGGVEAGGEGGFEGAADVFVAGDEDAAEGGGFAEDEGGAVVGGVGVSGEVDLAPAGFGGLVEGEGVALEDEFFFFESEVESAGGAVEGDAERDL